MLRKKEYYESMIGRKQGHITILCVDHVEPKTGRMWRCRCDCGSEFLASTSALNGGRQNCEKCAAEATKNRTQKQLGKHMQSKTRLWRVWQAMKSRCTFVGDTDYKHYGGRGITVHPEWRDNFEAFRDWAMANGYRDDLTIERKNVNEGYSPENCEWIPFRDQKYNKRSARLITVAGETHLLTEWARIIGVSHSAIIYAEKRGRTAEEYIAKRLGEAEGE